MWDKEMSACFYFSIHICLLLAFWLINAKTHTVQETQTPTPSAWLYKKPLLAIWACSFQKDLTALPSPIAKPTARALSI